MRSIKNIIALFISVLFCSVLYGCGKDTPTDIVNNYLGKIQSGDFDIKELIKTTLEESKNKNIANTDISDETANKLLENIKKMTFKVNSESTYGDTAKVNVTANTMDLGPVIGNTLNEGIPCMLKQMLSKDKMTDEEKVEYFNGLIDKYLDQVTFSDKTEDITLTKSEGKWKIKVDDSLEKLLTGISMSDINSINNLNN